jgi:hypothetical protein
VNTAGTVHQNINFRWADIYVSHYDVKPTDGDGQYGNGYAGTLCSRHNLKASADKAYTVRNVHCYDGKINAVCKMGGLLGGSWGTLTVENCSVEGYWIENHEVNCTNTYYEEVAGGLASLEATFYTEGECGGLIGFIAKNATITDCAVKDTKMKCYGQQDKPTRFNGLAAMLTFYIPGRHVNQFIGDIRTQSSDQSNLVTVSIVEPVVSKNMYVGSGYMYDKKIDDNEISADSSQATSYDYNHSGTSYIGSAYYIGADVLRKHFKDYPGYVYVTKDGNKTTISLDGGLV